MAEILPSIQWVKQWQVTWIAQLLRQVQIVQCGRYPDGGEEDVCLSGSVLAVGPSEVYTVLSPDSEWVAPLQPLGPRVHRNIQGALCKVKRTGNVHSNGINFDSSNICDKYLKYFVAIQLKFPQFFLTSPVTCEF